MMSTAQTSFEASSSQNQLDFLRMAAGDDRFRAELQSNPSAALARFGWTLDESDLPEQVSLPNKHEVRKAAEADGEFHEAWFGFLTV